MLNAVATILATVISAAISVSVAMISYASARSASESAIEAKINELKQGQITEILHQRIERYPSLWKLCQESFAVPSLMRSPPPEGWNVELSKALESWHAEHGVFLSQESYLGVWYLRKVANRGSRASNALKCAHRLSSLLLQPRQGAGAGEAGA
jgi:hypothetical protein